MWKTISTLDEATLRKTLYHAAVCHTSHSAMLFQIFDLHHARIRAEHEAAVKAAKAKTARIKREQKKVLEFSQRVNWIEYYLFNDPIDRKPCRMTYTVVENKVKPRIAKTTAKATSPDTNFATRCNAPETLRKIAWVIADSPNHSGLGSNVVAVWEQDDCIKESKVRC
jgi:hypothetical protein